MTVKFITSSRLPTDLGEFVIHAFADSAENKEHIALVYGKLAANEKTLCRVHSECLTGDALFSLRCDCGSQLREAMHRIANRGSGVILYLRQEGRGIGLLNKIKAYQLQDAGADTVEANEQLGFEPDSRDYKIAQPMLEHFKVKRVKLMTNNPDKVGALQALGIEVTERVPIHTGINTHNKSYLSVKVDKLGHLE